MTDASMQPVITHIGLSKLMAAHQAGQTLKISHVKAGDGHAETAQGYVPTPDMTDLKHTCQRVVVDGGQIKGQEQNQLHLTAVLDDAGDPAPSTHYSVYEIGFYLEDGTLFAIYASEEKLAEKVIGTDFILMFDITLTGDAADNVVIDGQAEWPLVQAKDNLLLGENLIKIHTQAQFDHVFNSSNGDLKIIPANTTIVLSPIQNTKENDIAFGAWGGKGDQAHNTFNARPGYILKNSIQFNSHTSVMGFNAEDTIVVNAQQDSQIILQGSEASPVIGVHLKGWSYDGRSGVDAYGGTSRFNLSPFELSHADRCRLNCHITNHHPNDNITMPVINVTGNGVNEALHVIGVEATGDKIVSEEARFNVSVLSGDGSYLALDSHVSLENNLNIKKDLTLAGDVYLNQDTKIHTNMFYIKGGKDECQLILEADTSNNNEKLHPEILFRQDGGEDHGAIELGSNALKIRSSSTYHGGIVFETGNEAGIENSVERLKIEDTGDVLVHESLIVDGDITIKGNVELPSLKRAIDLRENINSLFLTEWCWFQGRSLTLTPDDIPKRVKDETHANFLAAIELQKFITEFKFTENDYLYDQTHHSFIKQFTSLIPHLGLRAALSNSNSVDVDSSRLTNASGAHYFEYFNFIIGANNDYLYYFEINFSNIRDLSSILVNYRTASGFDATSAVTGSYAKPKVLAVSTLTSSSSSFPILLRVPVLQTVL